MRRQRPGTSIERREEGRDALELLAEQALLRLGRARPRLEHLGDDARLELGSCVGDPGPRLLTDGDARLGEKADGESDDEVEDLKVGLQEKERVSTSCVRELHECERGRTSRALTS